LIISSDLELKYEGGFNRLWEDGEGIGKDPFGKGT
jgi:hypothetical protein